ncbi:MAG TPA: phage tail tape measure protein [Conexibacter sp.]|jgi:hypothetical protein|nr:phage tail tape measure protein [Conexibacter sp.]
MSDMNPTLSLIIQAQDRATNTLKLINSEVGAMAEGLRTKLKGVRTEADLLSRTRPVQIIRAEQIVQMANYQRQLAAITAETQRTGKVTGEQAAKMRLLQYETTRMNAATEAQIAAQQRHRITLDRVTAGVVGFAAAVAIESAKAAVSWDNLTHNIGVQTGWSGKALTDFMGSVRTAAATSAYPLQEVADAAVVLRKRFGETGPEIAKNTELFLSFARASKQDVTTALTSLDKTLRQFNVPASQAVSVMDEMLSVSQHTQKPLADIITTLDRFGPQFQAMGLGMKQALGLLGAFEVSGVNTDFMARGLSKAIMAAQREVAAAGGSAKQSALKHDELSLAVQTAAQRVDTLRSTIPRTTTEQAKLSGEISVAQQRYDIAKQKLDLYTASVAKAKDGHLTIQSVLQGELQTLENAKTKTDRLNASVALFGGRAGPAFAKALDNGKIKLQEVQKWLDSSTGATQRADDEWRRGLNHQWEIAKNQLHDIGVTLGQDFIPAFRAMTTVVDGASHSLDGFIRQHKTLMEVVGGGAAGVAGLSLLGRHGGILGAPVRGTLGRLPGPLGEIFAKDPFGPGTIYGMTGTPAKAGSAANPIVTWVKNGGGGRDPLPTIVKDAEGVAAGAESRALLGLKSTLGLAGAAAMGISGFAAASKAKDDPLNKLNAFAHGMDPTNVLHLVGLPSVSDLLPKVQKTGPNMALQRFLDGYGIQQNHPILTAPGVGRSFNAGKIPDPRDLPEKYRQLTDAIGALQDRIDRSHGQTQKNLSSQLTQLLLVQSTWQTAMVNQARYVNDFSTEVGKALAGVHQVTPQLVGKIIGDIAKLPPSARAQAADMAVGMAAELTDKGKLPQGSARTIRDAITGHFRGMAIDSVKAADAMATGVSHDMGSLASVISAGMSLIGQVLNGDLKALGVNAVRFAVQHPTQLAADVGTGLGIVSNLFGATGMRVPGPAGHDNTPIWSPRGQLRGIVAGSELLVANRHTEARVDRMLALHGTSLGREVAGEHRPHSAPMFATGGRLSGSRYSAIQQAASVIASHNTRYGWGAGHGDNPVPLNLGAYDCSSAVSAVVQAAGYKVPTDTTPALGSDWRFPSGPGAVTVFYRGGPQAHTFMQIGSRYWGTSGSYRPAGSGPGWFDATPSQSYLSMFSTVHPPDLAGSAGQIQAIQAPKVSGPAGAMRAIAQAALSRATRAANRYLATTNAGSSGGGNQLRDLIGKVVGATVYGGPGDPTSGSTGADGTNLYRNPLSFAELDMGTALGHLPFGTKLRLSAPTGRFATAEKHDIGRGGGPIQGKHRALDLWWQLANTLGLPGTSGQWSGLIGIERAMRGARFAGAFKDGGAVTANRPTMAIFGENGTETAMFLPHAQLGARIAAAGYQGHTRTGSSGLLETWHNPPGAYFTQDAWRTYQDTHKRGPRAKAHHYDRPIEVPGVGQLGSFTDTTSGALNIAGDISKLSDATWKKVVAGILAALSKHSDSYDLTALQHIPLTGTRRRNLAAQAIGRVARIVSRDAANIQTTAQDTLATAQAHDQLYRTPVAGAIHQFQLGQGQLGALTGDRGQLLALEQRAIALHNTRLKDSIVKQIAQIDKASEGSAVSLLTAGQNIVAAVTAKYQTAIQHLQTRARFNGSSAVGAASAQVGLVANEVSALTEQRSVVAAQYYQALRKHNRKLAAALRGELDDLGNALDQAQADLHDAVQAQIDATQQQFERASQLAATNLSILQAQQHLQGTDVSAFQALKDRQGGFLTPAQQQQAQQALQGYIAGVHAQEDPLKHELSYDQSLLPTLTGSDADAMRQKIADLTLQIAQLDGSIHDQTLATQTLTSATNTNTAATQQAAGQVTFQYQGQSYLAGGTSTPAVGQSSTQMPNLGVGV